MKKTQREREGERNQEVNEKNSTYASRSISPTRERSRGASLPPSLPPSWYAVERRKRNRGFPLPDDLFLLPFTGDRVYIKNPVYEGRSATKWIASTLQMFSCIVPPLNCGHSSASFLRGITTGEHRSAWREKERERERERTVLLRSSISFCDSALSPTAIPTVVNWKLSNFEQEQARNTKILCNFKPPPSIPRDWRVEWFKFWLHKAVGFTDFPIYFLRFVGS